jgi:hypothetical protein
MSTRVLDRLHHEWQHISFRSIVVAEAQSWGLPGSPVHSLDDLLRRSGYIVATGHPSTRLAPPLARGGDASSIADRERVADAYLLRLVELAAAVPLAARVVLQRVLPGLGAAARRHAGMCRRDDLLDDLVANSWSVIRAYPVARRPQRVASNLVRDITFQTVVRPSRLKSARSEVPMLAEPDGTSSSSSSSSLPSSSPSPEPLAELLELVGAARRSGHIDERDVRLIDDLLTHPCALDVAISRQVTSRTIRNHRDAVVHRLRSSVAA